MLDYDVKKAEGLADRSSVSYRAGREAFSTNTVPSKDFNQVRAEETYALMAAKKRTGRELQSIISSYLDDIPSGEKLILSMPGDKRMITDAIDREKNDYRFGYIDELVDFLVEKNIEFSPRQILSHYIREKPEPAVKTQDKHVLKSEVSKILLTESGLTGYRRGFMLVNPNSWLVNALQDTETGRRSRAGYELGFMARTMKEYRYPMKNEEVPTEDTILYFLEGLGKINLGLSEEFSEISERYGSLLMHELPSIEDRIIEHELIDKGTGYFNPRQDRHIYLGRRRMDKFIFKSPQQKAYELGRRIRDMHRSLYSFRAK